MDDMTCSAFVAMSLDGYIARSNGDIQWLHLDAPVEDPDADYGYREFLSGIDALVMGRNTFLKVLSFGAWPYGDLPVYVLSAARLPADPKIPGTVHQLSGPPGVILDHVGRDGATRVYVDGGETIQRFLAAGLLNTLVVSILPILIGNGIRLFAETKGDTALVLRSSRAYGNGLVQQHYDIVRPPVDD